MSSSDESVESFAPLRFSELVSLLVLESRKKKKRGPVDFDYVKSKIAITIGRPPPLSRDRKKLDLPDINQPRANLTVEDQSKRQVEVKGLKIE
jgi:hypothetical protein